MNFAEKLKNLFLWKDPQKTKFLIFFTLLGWIAVKLLTYKMIAVLIVIDTFVTNRNAYK